MAWGNKTSATQLANITSEQYFDAIIELAPGESAQVQVSVDFPSSPTDHAVVSVYGTLDAAAETWDLVPLLSFQLDKGADPSRRSFLLSGVYRARVGIKRSGSTDTIPTADLSYRKDGITA